MFVEKIAEHKLVKSAFRYSGMSEMKGTESGCDARGCGQYVCENVFPYEDDIACEYPDPLRY